MQKRTKYLIAAVLAAAVGTTTVATVSYAYRDGSGPGNFHMRHFGKSPHGHGMGMGMRAIIGPALFQTVDGDGDGKITQAEIDKVRAERFAKYDRDGNGKLNLAEFDELLRELTQPVTARAFQMLDPNADAAITAKEFEWPFANIVKRFDRNGDGAISIEDHRRFRGQHKREKRDGG
ncbi:MAG: EF-hand domain-containing protein [Alphaproteobacteria bacterium]|mgnify:CR=1 FL=1|jgi:hypothetical protein|nr:EF-hand domain-containing protein [Alphaproteobacteria bacterium]|tara:strand:- start:10 stop:540 length:531 start_codon:yes stop_codon:yes gene_type:complete